MKALATFLIPLSVGASGCVQQPAGAVDPTPESPHSAQGQAFESTFASNRVKIDSGLTIHYRQAGIGDTTIVLIPGWMMSTDVFEHQLAHFEGSTRYRALAYDPRGQGQSSKPVEGHTYQQHARDLARLIEKLELKNIVLAGWSYGVTEQLAYVNQFGAEKVKAMVMIDTGPKISGATRNEWVWYLNDDSDGYSRLFTEGIIEDRDNVVREFGKWMLENPSPAKVAWVAGIARQTSSSVAAITNATGFYLDYSEDLKALNGKIPLLYVVRDEMKNVADDWIRANTPSATAVYMGKHMMFWERPNEFNGVLDEFLKRVDGLSSSSLFPRRPTSASTRQARSSARCAGSSSPEGPHRAPSPGPCPLLGGTPTGACE